MKGPPRPGPLVEVAWLDAYTTAMRTWKSGAEIKAAVAEAPRGEPSRTVGYLLERTKHRLVVLASTQQGVGGGCWVIPRGCVTEVRRLRGRRR